MTPEEERIARKYAKQPPHEQWLALGFLNDAFEALDAERAKTAELSTALDLAIADTDDAEARLDREREVTKDLRSYIVELGEAKARESEQVGVERERNAKLERVAEAARARLKMWTMETYMELAESLADLDNNPIQTELTIADAGLDASEMEWLQKHKATREAIRRFVSEFQMGAIPETNEYANGWNDCRKRMRAELNRLVAGMANVDTP